jgi:hypothetical protein
LDRIGVTAMTIVGTPERTTAVTSGKMIVMTHGSGIERRRRQSPPLTNGNTTVLRTCLPVLRLCVTLSHVLIGGTCAHYDPACDVLCGRPSKYWDKAPAGYEGITPMKYKEMMGKLFTLAQAALMCE